jgi:hypothetical protein
MYEITKHFLIIRAKNDEEFFQLYDQAVEKIPDTAFNKKWYRSASRTLVGSELGLKKYIIELNKPTLQKIALDI